MADCSLDELLSDITNLSISERSFKENKKTSECSMFDSLWSDDDENQIETSLNLTDICSLHFSGDETKNLLVSDLLSDHNITVRRKTTKKRNFSKANKRDNYSSQTEDKLYNLDNPNFDYENSNSQFKEGVSIVRQEEKTVLQSSVVIDDECSDVCRKLQDYFEQADISVLSCLPNTDSKDCLGNKSNDANTVTTREEIIEKSLDFECNSTETKGFEQVSLESTLCSEKTSSLAITSCRKEDESDVSNHSCLLTKNRSESNEITTEPVCEKDEKISDQTYTVELGNFKCTTAHKEPVESGSRSEILPVNSKLRISYPNLISSNTKEDVDYNTPVFRETENDVISVSDENILAAQEAIIDARKESSLTCQLVNGYKDVKEDDQFLSNKENLRLQVLLSSDSDSVWEDKIESDESDCEKHDISLSSRLGIKLSLQENIENTNTPTTSGSIRKINNQVKGKTIPSTNIQISDSSDDEAFEQFLDKMKTPKPKSHPVNSIESFIVEDASESSEEDDRRSAIAFPLTTPTFTTTVEKNLSVKKLNIPRFENTNTPMTSGSIRTINNQVKGKTIPSTNIQISDSSDDEAFEQFLDKMKTPKPKSRPINSVKSFIVEDATESSKEDDERNAITFPLTTPTFTTPVEKTLSVKKLNTPRFETTPLKDKKNKENTTRKISSENSIKKILTPYANTPHKFWQNSRDALVGELYKFFNETVFENKLPVDMPIIWNKHMRKTAGFCYYIGSMTKKCRIELSDKVVDSCDRIRDTLIHELCHAATWLIDGIKAGHGPHWKRWAHKAKMVHSDLPPISRCHSYDINYKFTYRCVKCHHSFGRHSKSVDLERSRCFRCLSRLELVQRLKKDGTPAKTRAPSKFSLFVKDNYSKIKAEIPTSTHQDIMKELSKQFAQLVGHQTKDATTT